MGERGQVTIFLIIAILVLVGVVLIIFLVNSGGSSEERKEVSKKITIGVENCLEDYTKRAILENGRTGGYFVTPEDTLNLSNEDIPLYKVRNSKKIPSASEMGNQIGLYLDTLLEFCIAEIDSSPFEFTFEEPSSEVLVVGTELKVKTKLNLKIQEKNSSSIIQDFSISLDYSKPLEVLNLAELIVDSTSSEGICLSCYGDEAVERNLEINTFLKNGTKLAFK